MFNEKSAIVNIWVRAIKNGDKTLEDVPNLFNLIEVVTKVIKGGEN